MHCRPTAAGRPRVDELAGSTSEESSSVWLPYPSAVSDERGIVEQNVKNGHIWLLVTSAASGARTVGTARAANATDAVSATRRCLTLASVAAVVTAMKLMTSSGLAVMSQPL